MTVYKEGETVIDVNGTRWLIKQVVNLPKPVGIRYLVTNVKRPDIGVRTLSEHEIPRPETSP